MNILDAIQGRQSIRSFKDKPVSKEILEKILDISRSAPSGGNTQPWKIYVLNQDLMKELESLVCQECSAPKIDKVVFPNTLAEPYWTGEKNWVTSQNIWSVNFMTGFSYGRFFPNQSLAVRLVKGL